jgi:hypothetical protein
MAARRKEKFTRATVDFSNAVTMLGGAPIAFGRRDGRLRRIRSRQGTYEEGESSLSDLFRSIWQE